MHLRKAHPEYAQHEAIGQGTSFAGNETDILTFLQQRAIESKDWVQLSSSLLGQAEAEMQNVRPLTHVLRSSLFDNMS